MDVLPQFAAVFAVFAVLGATLWFLRRRGALRMSGRLPLAFNTIGRLPLVLRRPRPGGKTKLLEHADRLQLSPTHSLSVIRMGDRAILIGTSPAGFYLVESSSWKSVQPLPETRE